MPRDRRVAALKMLEDCCQRDTPQAHPHLPVASLDAMGKAVKLERMLPRVGVEHCVGLSPDLRPR